MKFKHLNLEKYKKILIELKKDLDLINPSLKEWNRNYFHDHEKRYESDIKFIEQYYKGGEILEIGSVPCHITYILKELGYPVIGLDIQPERILDFINKHNLTVKKCNIETEKIPFEDNNFDFIMFNEIFEHLRIDPIYTLKEVNRVLSSNGIMILTTPNLYSIKKIISFNLGKGFNNPFREFEKLQTLGHVGHIREYSTKEVIEFLENTGFKIIDVKYEVYNRNKGILGFFLYYLCRILPRWRPYQIIISKKR